MKALMESIKMGYVPENFEGATVITFDGYIAPENLCAYVNGQYYHIDRDSDEIAYDEIGDEYILSSDAVICYGRHGRRCTSHRDECIVICGTYYHERYLCDNDIVETVGGEYDHIDNVYYWESDGEYHYEEEASLWGYGDGPTPPDYRNGDAFGIGFEIEKNNMPSFQYNREYIYSLHGAALERDGSVSNGFELITPIYSLYSLKTDEKIMALKDFINIENGAGAGGHINFSKVGMTDIQLLNKVRGYLPLIYAMYPKRVNNSYCQAKKISELIDDRDKYQSIRLRSEYIEFRIFPAFHSIETALFRLNLFRIIGATLGDSFLTVLTRLITEGSELNKLFRESFYQDGEKFTDLVRRALDMDKIFGTNRLNAETIRKIDNKLKTIKTK